MAGAGAARPRCSVQRDRSAVRIVTYASLLACGRGVCRVVSAPKWGVALCKFLRCRHQCRAVCLAGPPRSAARSS
jgi:hypothetical protein